MKAHRALCCLLSLTPLFCCKKDGDRSSKNPSPESCEAGSHKAVPTLVVEAAAEPFDVAVDETSVYWTEVGGSGVVGAIDKDGANRRQLATDSANLPFAIALGPTHVFFQTSHEIKRVPKDGSEAAQTLATGFDNLHSNGLIFDGDHVYFAATSLSEGSEVVFRINADGTEPVNIVTQSGSIDALGVDADYLYFNSGSVVEPTLVRVPKTGGAPETIATGRGCHNVALNGFQVFCAADYFGPFRVNVTTKMAIDLCTEWNPQLLVKDARLVGTGFYLLVEAPDGSGLVLRVSTAGTGTLLASGLGAPLRMTTDGTYLYVTEKDAGRIRRIQP